MPTYKRPPQPSSLKTLPVVVARETDQSPHQRRSWARRAALAWGPRDKEQQRGASDLRLATPRFLVCVFPFPAKLPFTPNTLHIFSSRRRFGKLYHNVPREIASKRNNYQNSLGMFFSKYIWAPCSPLPALPSDSESVTSMRVICRRSWDSSIYQPSLRPVH